MKVNVITQRNNYNEINHLHKIHLQSSIDIGNNFTENHLKTALYNSYEFIELKDYIENQYYLDEFKIYVSGNYGNIETSVYLINEHHCIIE